MLHPRANFVLGALAVAAAFIFLSLHHEGTGRVHCCDLNTPYGRLGFKEYDWSSRYPNSDSKQLTIERYRELVRERFLYQQIQPKGRYSTVFFLGPHSYAVHRPLTFVLGSFIAAVCVFALLVWSILKVAGDNRAAANPSSSH